MLNANTTIMSTHGCESSHKLDVISQGSSNEAVCRICQLSSEEMGYLLWIYKAKYLLDCSNNIFIELNLWILF